jgi:hypothetical protein
MKYETPEMTTLMPAINAIQTENPSGQKATTPSMDSSFEEHIAAYADWE